MVMWLGLDKKGKTKQQGTIRLRLSFSAEKNSQVAVQEHKHLLRILLLHELETSKVAPYWWSGECQQYNRTFKTHSDFCLVDFSILMSFPKSHKSIESKSLKVKKKKSKIALNEP